MKRIYTLLVLIFVISNTMGWAGEKDVATAIIFVNEMTCATCPITVRKAMKKVDGVKEVSVDFESEMATVTYDRSVTTAQTVADASSNVGFPAKVIEADTE